MIRRLRVGELDFLKHLCNKYYEDEFEFPDLEHCRNIPIVEVNGQVIGGGIFREIPEAIIILDKDSSRKARAEALRELINLGDRLVCEARHEGMHVFVQDESFEKILIKHFGFKETIGKVLFRGL